MRYFIILLTTKLLTNYSYAQTKIGATGTPTATLDVQNGGGSFDFWNGMPIAKLNKVKMFVNSEDFNNLSTTAVNLNNGNSLGSSGIVDFFLQAPTSNGTSTTFTIYTGFKRQVAFSYKVVGGAGATITQSGTVFTINITNGPVYLLSFGGGNGTATIKTQSGTVSGKTTIANILRAFE